MPYICMIREDIPNGTLQILDLEPNVSQRNPAIDPPGQTKYVNRAQNDTVATLGAGPITTRREYSGLAAYLLANVEDQDNGGTALTAAMANAIATAILAQIDAKDPLTATVINGLIQAETGGAVSTIDGGASTGSLADVLKILAGGEYVLPAGTEVEDVGNAYVPNTAGAFTTGTFRHTYESGSLLVSIGDGELATYSADSYSYGGTAGAAVVVLDDDGSVMS